jgi:hypothetical protein
MPWDASPGGGFSTPGVTPWLPLADPPGTNVADQRADADSTLWLCRRLLALRRTELSGGIAPKSPKTDFEHLPAREGQWVYRVGSLVVTANFSAQPTALPLAAGEVLLATSVTGTAAQQRVLGPWEGVVARLAIS